MHLFRVAVASLLSVSVPVFARAEPPKPNTASITIQDLGNVFPGAHARAEAINNRGDVVGTVILAVAGAVEQRPALWTRNGDVELFLGDGTFGQSWDLNERGQVIGIVYTDTTWLGYRGFLWTRQRGAVELPDGFSPAAINNRGQVAGTCFVTLGHGEPCVWEDGGVVRLDQGVQGDARGINDRGSVVGTINDMAYVWTPDGGFAQLREAALFRPTAINNHGELAGSVGLPFTPLRAARWERGELATLEPNSVGWDINERGWITGSSFSTGGSFVWLPSDVVIDLPSLGGGISNATGINARGDVVGIATDEQGFGHAVIWTIRLAGADH